MTNNIYIIPMFPYPSGYCHVGHARNYIFSDIITRYHQMTSDKSVVHAFGVDAFGLPAENAAVKYNIKARHWTDNNTKHIVEVLDKLNIQYNKDLWLNTTDTNYIRLNQFIFQILFEHGYLYNKLSYQNWDPEDQTILSNEQVINGRGWRSGALVQKKLIKSWFIKIHDQAKFLKSEIKDMDLWASQVKKMQNSWIAKVNGYIVKFKFTSREGYLNCFTKKPGYIAFGKFIAIAYTHPLAIEFMLNNGIVINETEVSELCILTDIEVINPYNNDVLKVYIGGYVIPYFASEALYGAPDFDHNDAIFADKINIKHTYDYDAEEHPEAHYDSKIIEDLIQQELVNTHEFYSLHDWCISRQRVWGCPIPVIYCDQCGVQIYINDELNNQRLDFISYKDLQQANLMVKCQCGKLAVSDTETLDTFFDSSWYYLNYLGNGIPYIKDVEEAKKYLSELLVKLPIDFYIGGIEHANLHLIYTRAIIKLLHTCLDIEYKSPIKTMINQGSVLYTAHLDDDNKYIDLTAEKHPAVAKTTLEKMSKSKFNTVSIDEVVNAFSTDALRFAIMSNMPIEVSYEWNTGLVETKFKFLNQITYLINNADLGPILHEMINDNLFINIDLSSEAHKILTKYTDCINEFKIHNAIAAIHELFNYIKKYQDNIGHNLLILLAMMYPITPHISTTSIIKILHINECKKQRYLTININNTAYQYKINILY